MDLNVFPTKNNLIAAKNSLQLSLHGFELMDKKRNVLIQALMELIDQAKEIQSEIDVTFKEAYSALERANIEMGIYNVEQLSLMIPEENSVRIKTRSVMGTEIPRVAYEKTQEIPYYSFYSTTPALDKAYVCFVKVKELTIRLSMIENSAYRLATSIKKTQKRANALKNITIPKYQERIAFITNALEEREREDFIRLKVIKNKSMENI